MRVLGLLSLLLSACGGPLELCIANTDMKCSSDQECQTLLGPKGYCSTRPATGDGGWNDGGVVMQCRQYC